MNFANMLSSESSMYDQSSQLSRSQQAMSYVAGSSSHTHLHDPCLGVMHMQSNIR